MAASIEKASHENAPDGRERRHLIVDMLEKAAGPVPGAKLAKSLGVSRQVIVQDVALLRTAGVEVVSTNRGYILVRDASDERGPTRLVKVRHTPEQTEAELDAIVDLGGAVESVMVNHRIYGCLEAPLDIRSRRDVRLFLEDLAGGVSSPLMTITDGYHFHLVRAESEEVLDEIVAELDRLGFSAPLTDYEREAL